MRFEVISNAAFTPKEFKQLMDQLEKDKMKPITHGQILQKVEELEEIKNYTYKGNEVDELIEKNIEENLRKGNTGVNFVLKIEALKTQVQEFRDKYDASGEKADLKEYKRLKAQLSTLQENVSSTVVENSTLESIDKKKREREELRVQQRRLKALD